MAPGVKGVAPSQSPQGQPYATEQAVSGQRLEGVCAATGIEAAPIGYGRTYPTTVRDDRGTHHSGRRAGEGSAHHRPLTTGPGRRPYRFEAHGAVRGALGRRLRPGRGSVRRNPLRPLWGWLARPRRCRGARTASARRPRVAAAVSPCCGRPRCPRPWRRRNPPVPCLWSRHRTVSCSAGRPHRRLRGAAVRSPSGRRRRPGRPFGLASAWS